VRHKSPFAPSLAPECSGPFQNESTYLLGPSNPGRLEDGPELVAIMDEPVATLFV